MTMHECPADGCDYSGPERSVLGHYSGKQDDAHGGGYAEAKQKLGVDSSEGGKSTTDGTGGTDVKTPAFPSAEGTNQSNDGGSLGSACPSCGGSKHVAPADNVLDFYRSQGVELGGQHVQTLQAADHACMSCGTAFSEGGD